MNPYTTLQKVDKKTGRQLVIVCLLSLPFILLSLSAFTFVPNTTQSMSVGTTLPQTSTSSRTLSLNVTDVSCSDVVTVEQIDWSGIRIYFNTCAIEHYIAIVADATAGAGAIGLFSLVCQECEPLVPWITAIVSGATAGIDSLQYASQDCGGAILDISWDGGIQFLSACSSQNNGS